MARLYNEEIIMTSNDNSITLTTHRILQKTSEVNKEILLRDIVSQEVIKKRFKYYTVLSLLFGIPAAILTLLYFTKSGPFEKALDNMHVKTNDNVFEGLLIVLLIFTLVSISLLLTRSEKYLKISGRFNDLEFSLKDLNDSSLNKFINRLSIESDNRKRDH